VHILRITRPHAVLVVDGGIDLSVVRHRKRRRWKALDHACAVEGHAPSDVRLAPSTKEVDECARKEGEQNGAGNSTADNVR